jgi:hypothetical protein
MVVPFNELPEEARIWVYQSNRKLSQQEVVSITALTSEFLSEWTAHGADLRAGFELRYDRFLVIGLDQRTASASGCSIDTSVRFIQSLEREFGIDLLDKMNVTYYNGEYIAYKPLDEFKKMAKARSVSARTVVFNNLVNTKADYETHWEVPASESWHSRFFS